MKPAEQPIRVLLVDDHQMILWGLRALVDSDMPHMEVVGSAGDIQDALSKFSCTLPDIVLLDLDLNGTSGLDILPTLIANNHTRVVVMTGTHDQAELDNAILNGARGILRKDVPAEQVLKAIHKVHQGELWVDQVTLGRVFGHMQNPARAPRLDFEAQKQATLTLKEKKIICTMIEQGVTVNKILAQRLFISEHTLRNHLTSIYQKLGVANRLELYVYAVRHGLCAPHDGRKADDERQRNLNTATST
jgi:DNA-binding NarL/FixJ family response regulator